MKENFARALPEILKAEGGYVDDPRDPGGATNLGITIGTLSRRLGRPATKAEVRALTPAAVAPIYREDYWHAVGADALPAGHDLVVFDAAVNSGPVRAKNWNAQTWDADVIARIQKFSARRLGFVQGLSTFAAFGAGWAKRIATVEATGVAWALAAQGVARPSVVLQKESQTAKGKADDAKVASGGAAGGVGGSVVAAPLSDHSALLLLAICGGIFLALALYALYRAHIHHARAEAYAALSEEVPHAAA